MRGSELLSLLSGGDRRSIAHSARASRIVHEGPARVAELAVLAMEDDWLVSMRALDLLEKLAHEHPEWVEPHREVFLGRLAQSDKWEVHLQIVRALPLFDWKPAERERAVEILRRDLEHPKKFVRAWALDSLATFAVRDNRLRPLVERALKDFEASQSKSLITRARNIRARLPESERSDPAGAVLEGADNG
jgi:hypothetical protein